MGFDNSLASVRHEVDQAVDSDHAAVGVLLLASASCSAPSAGCLKGSGHPAALLL